MLRTERQQLTNIFYLMKTISLNKEEFKLFNSDDQFGFFYDEEGWPQEDAENTFESDVDVLFKKYDYIIVDIEDNIQGQNSSVTEIIMTGVAEAFDIAKEIKEN